MEMEPHDEMTELTFSFKTEAILCCIYYFIIIGLLYITYFRVRKLSIAPGLKCIGHICVNKI